jgi:hypothetical protein
VFVAGFLNRRFDGSEKRSTGISNLPARIAPKN